MVIKLSIADKYNIQINQLYFKIVTSINRSI